MTQPAAVNGTEDGATNLSGGVQKLVGNRRRTAESKVVPQGVHRAAPPLGTTRGES